MNFVDGCWWFQWLWHCLLCIGSNRSLVLISDLGPCHSCHACIFLQCHIPFKGAKVNPRRKHLDPCPCTEVRWFEPDNTGSACAKILLVSKIQFHILSKIVFACFPIYSSHANRVLCVVACKFHACWRSAYHTVEESNYGGLLSTCSFLRGAFHPGMENKCLGWLSCWFRTEQRAQEQCICTWAQTFHKPRIYNAGSSALTTYRNIHSKHVTPVITPAPMAIQLRSPESLEIPHFSRFLHLRSAFLGWRSFHRSRW